MWSKSSEVGKPLATTEANLKSPDIRTSLTSHGSKVWKNICQLVNKSSIENCNQMEDNYIIDKLNTYKDKESLYFLV